MSAVARRYAKALFLCAQELETLADLEHDAQRLLAWVQDIPEFSQFLADRFIAPQEAIDVFQTLFSKASFTPLMQSFLFYMARVARLSCLKACLQNFLTRVDHTKGLLRGHVTTVQPLSQQHLDQLTTLLTNKMRQEVHLTSRVDPKLLGGLVVVVGPYMIDASLEARLLTLEERLKG